MEGWQQWRKILWVSMSNYSIFSMKELKTGKRSTSFKIQSMWLKIWFNWGKVLRIFIVIIRLCLICRRDLGRGWRNRGIRFGIRVSFWGLVLKLCQPMRILWRFSIPRKRGFLAIQKNNFFRSGNLSRRCNRPFLLTKPTTQTNQVATFSHFKEQRQSKVRSHPSYFLSTIQTRWIRRSTTARFC